MQRSKFNRRILYLSNRKGSQILPGESQWDKVLQTELWLVSLLPSLLSDPWLAAVTLHLYSILYWKG